MSDRERLRLMRPHWKRSRAEVGGREKGRRCARFTDLLAPMFFPHGSVGRGWFNQQEAQFAILPVVEPGARE